MELAIVHHHFCSQTLQESYFTGDHNTCSLMELYYFHPEMKETLVVAYNGQIVVSFEEKGGFCLVDAHTTTSFVLGCSTTNVFHYVFHFHHTTTTLQFLLKAEAGKKKKCCLFSYVPNSVTTTPSVVFNGCSR